MNFLKFAAFITLTFIGTGTASAEQPPPNRLIHTEFYFADEITSENGILEGLCVPSSERTLAPLVTDVVVSLAGKAAASVVDAVAKKAQAEAVILEAISSMEGFYGPKEIAAREGCLVIHNGRAADSIGATFKAIFQVLPSEDATAFRFNVKKWTFTSFFVPKSSNWFQDETRKDFVLRIEFLTPGTESLGKRAVFVERSLIDISSKDLSNAYIAGQNLPWFSSPPKPANLVDGRNYPLNIRTTIIETSRPKQLGVWLNELATSKKSDIVASAENAVRTQLDPDFASIAHDKKMDKAATAFSAYKLDWDSLYELSTNIPTLPNSPTEKEKTKFQADTVFWRAKVAEKRASLVAKGTLARGAYESASLDWPGDLPDLK